MYILAAANPIFDQHRHAAVTLDCTSVREVAVSCHTNSPPACGECDLSDVFRANQTPQAVGPDGGTHMANDNLKFSPIILYHIHTEVIIDYATVFRHISMYIYIYYIYIYI